MTKPRYLDMITSVILKEQRKQFQLNKVPPPLEVRRRATTQCGSSESDDVEKIETV